MKNNDKEKIINEYLDLSKNIGRLASKEDCIKHNNLYNKIIKSFNSLSNLKEEIKNYNTKNNMFLLNDKREEILDEFIKLSLRLGKIPSKRDCIRFKLYEKIRYNFEGLHEIKEFALNKNPELINLIQPRQIDENDILLFREKNEKKFTNKKNLEIIKNIDVLDYIKDFSKNIFQEKIKPVKPFVGSKNTDRIINLILSDLHFGSDIKSEETGNENYGRKEEARRLATIVKEVINYKINYRKNTELEVLLLGDIIQGKLHDSQDGAPIAEQICRAIHLLSQALLHLCANFKKVRVRCSSGNHDRITSRHQSRAINQKWDSYHTIIAYSLKACLSQQKNIEFFIPKTPYGEYEVFGQKILYTHGDTVLKPGQPSSFIKIKEIEQQLNRINASLHDKEEYKVCIVGHVHTASQIFLNNGSVLITNGALVSPDEYSISLGILESQCGQMIFESVPGFAVGDTRFIRVGKENDNDESLDKIIKPFNNL